MADLPAQLARARHKLSIRGLKHASSFVCELYASLDTLDRVHESVYDMEIPTDGLFDLAKSYFDLQEYARAAHVLRGKTNWNALEFFLMQYSLFLAGERRKEQLSLEMKVNTSSSHKPAVNPHLDDIRRDLQDADDRGVLDAFGLYLYGIVLKQCSDQQTALSVFWRSIHAFPWNWSAWLEVASQETSLVDESLVGHCMTDLYQAHKSLLECDVPSAIEILERLKKTFPSSAYLTSQLARAHYETRDFDAAHDLFQQLTLDDPYRLQLMDLYSDVLFVKEAKSALSELAHHVQAIDKYSPETNCVIGNYYALKGQHERAIAYFTRAISLDTECLAAWTLIGHEYIQMKNTNAAIEVYRRALEVAPNDYRAWYGLGQAYELLDLYHYSVYYYQKAAGIRPYDARMWVALGGSYEKLNQMSHAKSCYHRAVMNKEAEGIAVFRLAKLYEESEQNHEKAAEYYRQHWLDRTMRGINRVDTSDAVRAVLFLGKYCMQRGDLVEAMEWCNKLLERDGPEKEEAKALLHEMRQMEFFTADRNMNMQH